MCTLFLCKPFFLNINSKFETILRTTRAPKTLWNTYFYRLYMMWPTYSRSCGQPIHIKMGKCGQCSNDQAYIYTHIYIYTLSSYNSMFVCVNYIYTYIHTYVNTDMSILKYHCNLIGWVVCSENPFWRLKECQQTHQFVMAWIPMRKHTKQHLRLFVYICIEYLVYSTLRISSYILPYIYLQGRNGSKDQAPMWEHPCEHGILGESLLKLCQLCGATWTLAIQ